MHDSDARKSRIAKVTPKIEFNTSKINLKAATPCFSAGMSMATSPNNNKKKYNMSKRDKIVDTKQQVLISKVDVQSYLQKTKDDTREKVF